ncbi:von Willebrand factor type A domain-containing protein [Nemania diffusa]|nr:von Willebrand factor type A domain-containing protein [Nemania diffusa]
MAYTSPQPPSPRRIPMCGCWYPSPKPIAIYKYISAPQHASKSYLPLEDMQAHVIVKDVSSRTVLTQTFSNNTKSHLKDVTYSFPLYDGVSVVSFTATIGDVQIQGLVKEKQQARREYKDAVDKGSLAGLLEQLPEASDVFVTSIGNVPAGARVVVEVVYIGELRHDAESNGTRFTIPSSIAPRYGSTPGGILASFSLQKTPASRMAADAIRVIVDFHSPEGCPIQQIQSPSHPITVSVGRTTDMPTTSYMANRGSATLSLGNTTLENDFVVIARVKDADVPKALLETHTTIPNQRALMATLVPRFNIPPTHGEIVFIVDRSSSMGSKIDMVIRAMTILLKSLPVGTKFNICSFGSRYSFLWPRSKSYNDENLNEALSHIDTFQSNFGGTEMHTPVQATISQRFTDMLLDVIILTDGEIWDQERLFNIIQKASTDHKSRFFSLGIGSGASTALVEGIATAGNGVSQFVAEGEKMDRKMIRLLKGALMPHIDDYSIEVKYKPGDDDFEMVDSVKEASQIDVILPTTGTSTNAPKPPISLFDDSLDPNSDDNGAVTSLETDDRFAHLPIISPPSILQAPYRVPPLYPFSRTTVYLLLDPSTYHRTPEAIILRGTCPQGPLELQIQVEDVGKGETIHQLAAKRAIAEIEKDGGWLAAATDKVDGTLIKNKYDGRWEEFREREAIRLGVEYQIVGKWCSFVAVEGQVERETVIVGGRTPPPPAPRLSSSTQTKRTLSRRQSSASDTGGSLFFSSPLPASPLPAPSFGPPSALMSRPSGPSQGPAPASSAYGSTKAPGVLHRLRVLPQPLVVSNETDSEPLAAFGAGPVSSKLQPTEPPLVNSDDDKMHEIIRLQKSNGSWEWEPRLQSLLGITLDLEKQSDTVATALAIAFLQKRMAHEADSWELIVEKARNWLGQQQGVDVEKEISSAEKLL